jgi:osmotically-inducible protein OsmY
MPGRQAERWNPMKARYVAALTIVAFVLLSTANPLQASETDRRIESSASKSYVFRTHLKDDDVKVHSSNGVGKAKNAAEKDLVIKIVSDIKGVKSVKNNMTVGKTG